MKERKIVFEREYSTALQIHVKQMASIFIIIIIIILTFFDWHLGIEDVHSFYTLIAIPQAFPVTTVEVSPWGTSTHLSVKLKR